MNLENIRIWSLVWPHLAMAVVALSLVTAKTQSLFEIHGPGTNGLTPRFLVEKSGTNRTDWSVEIDLVAESNCPAFTWLKVPGTTCSRLRLWRINGSELPPSQAAALEANAPASTTVSNVMASVHPRSFRPMQWWPGANASASAGQAFGLSGFSLRSAFEMHFTNDALLQIVPLIYKVDTNRIAARLVEFPPTKLKLLANGTVQKLE